MISPCTCGNPSCWDCLHQALEHSRARTISLTYAYNEASALAYYYCTEDNRRDLERDLKSLDHEVQELEHDEDQGVV